MMETPRYTGNRVINGTFGTLWLDGEEVFDIESFEAKVTFDRESVTMAGNLDEDSKITGQKGEGNFKVKKIYSRGLAKFIEMTKTGIDVRSEIIGKLSDPDTIYGQSERISIGNVWFDEFTLMEFEMGKKLEREFPFGFTPSSIGMIDEIK